MKVRRWKLFCCGFLLFFFCGCASTSSVQNSSESQRDVEKAIGSIAEAVSGKQLTDQEIKKLEKQMQNDPEAKQLFNRSQPGLNGSPRGVKYCPEDGKRYAPHLEYCPGSKTPLKWVDE